MRTHPLIAACLLLVAPLAARAQLLYVDPELRLITPHELAAFDRIFGTTPEQQTAERALRDAAAAQLRESEAKGGKLVEAWQALPADQRTPKARAELLQKLEALDIGEKAHAQLRSDLRALLTPEQEARWRRFEYFLRRETVLNSDSGWGRDKTNVLALAEAVGARRADPAFSELLDQYERELDALLGELQGAADALNAQMRGARETEYARIREKSEYWAVAKRLVLFNAQYVRRLAALLPDDKAAALRTLFLIVDRAYCKV